MSERANATTLRGVDASDSGRPAGRDGDGAATSVPRQLSATQHELAQIVVATMRANCALNYRVRVGLALFGLASSVLALTYAAMHAGAIASAASHPGKITAALLAGTLPVLLLVVLAALAGFAVWAVHARGMDEIYSTLDTVSRLEREGEVAVSSRGLIHAFEEKLQSTRRAFTLLLWLGRTLFVVCLALCSAAVISAIAGGDALLTGALGGSSVVGAFLGVVTKVPQNIAHQLADIIQIQTVITGSDRQISLLETAAIDAINRRGGHAKAHDEVLAVQRRMDRVVESAVRRIEELADPERVTAPRP
jgi:hypothetical protein